jgi:tyrosinase
VRVIVVLTVLLLAAPAAAEAAPLRVRKDAAAMTAKEKRQFVQALHAVKVADYPYDHDPHGITWYDEIVRWHTELNPCGDPEVGRGHGIWGHGGPMFLPWHRQYLLALEDAMRAVTRKHVTIPYWDWTRDESTKAVLRDDLMGGSGNELNGYRLERGPFSYDKWRLNIDNTALYGYALMSSTHLTRNIASPYQDKLTVKDDLPFAMARPLYDAAPFSDATDARTSFRMALEGLKDTHDPITGGDAVNVQGCTGPVLGRGTQAVNNSSGTLHNQVHGYVGGVTGVGPDGGSLMGTMAVPLASPNDPIFFLHHANIDRLWFEWQKTHGDDPYRPRGAHFGEEFPGNEIDSPMRPWTTTPREMASAAVLGYTYAAPGATKASTARRRRAALLCRLRRL